VTTPSGWPALVADPAFVPGESRGIEEFLADCEAALMGRTTFEPALDSDAARLLERVLAATTAVTSMSSAGPERSRPIAPWERSTSSS
jgi:hypothetical protein